MKNGNYLGLALAAVLTAPTVQADSPTTAPDTTVIRVEYPLADKNTGAINGFRTCAYLAVNSTSPFGGTVTNQFSIVGRAPQYDAFTAVREDYTVVFELNSIPAGIRVPASTPDLQNTDMQAFVMNSHDGSFDYYRCTRARFDAVTPQASKCALVSRPEQEDKVADANTLMSLIHKQCDTAKDALIGTVQTLAAGAALSSPERTDQMRRDFLQQLGR